MCCRPTWGIAASTAWNNAAAYVNIPGGVLPCKGLLGTCGQPGYVFWDFCLKQGIEFIIFCLNQGTDKQQNFYKLLLINIRVKYLKQGIKNRNSVLNRVGKSAIFVLNRVRV